MSKYLQVSQILADARDSINAILSDSVDEHHRVKLTSQLDRDINYIRLVTGAGDMQIIPREKPGPATTIGGKKIERPVGVKKKELEPTQERIKVLKEKVEGLYQEFLTIPTEQLVRDYEQQVIRGVAKKAKMKVTKDDPEKITEEFIETIKDEIRRLEGKNDATVLLQQYDNAVLAVEEAMKEVGIAEAELKEAKETKKDKKVIDALLEYVEKKQKAWEEAEKIATELKSLLPQ